jgi:hypothetical protein
MRFFSWLEVLGDGEQKCRYGISKLLVFNLESSPLVGDRSNPAWILIFGIQIYYFDKKIIKYFVPLISYKMRTFLTQKN